MFYLIDRCVIQLDPPTLQHPVAPSQEIIFLIQSQRRLHRPHKSTKNQNVLNAVNSYEATSPIHTYYKHQPRASKTSREGSNLLKWGCRKDANIKKI